MKEPDGPRPAKGTDDTPTVSFASESQPREGDSPERQFLPGTQFGKRYRIVELLGSGAMGEVYRADDLQLGQSVALKFLPPHLADDPAALARLRNEVRVARQISHANVCRVYDIGEADGQYFLSMEYIDGEDLGSVLRRLGRPTREKSLEIARQLCVGLAAAHETGVLHRDLKPANVMIDGRGRVRITDFGLAGFVGELALEGRAGTPGYMAPELFSGGIASARTDIYALGVVLYELFTGRRAFDTDTPSGGTRPQRDVSGKAPSEYVDDIDPVVEEIILRCVDHDPGKRPASALAVAAVLPGVDLVAAALAAGQTPTPEMVAAAGGKGALRLGIAATCLASIIGGLLLIASLNERVSLHGLAPPAKPTVIVADQARKILERLGYPAPDHVAFGWEDYESYLDHVEETDSDPERWSELRDRRPPVYWLWYRESPFPLVPYNETGQIRFADPPLVLPGMVGMKLDGEGRLAVLRIIPPQVGDAVAVEEPFDYTWLFEAAGLDPADFREVDPRWIPRDYADARAAWEGHYPGQPDWPLRVEAATHAGRPVYFNVLEAFDLPFDPARRGEPSVLERAGRGIGLVFLIIALVVPPVVARRNWKRGSGDRTGALRLGFAVWILALSSWALVADHTANIDLEVRMLFMALALSLLMGVWSALIYLALEPYVRRLWPETMISWTRLLMGRFGDPRVGRDVLVGAFAGVLVIVIQRVEWLVPTWFGVAPRQPYRSMEAMFLGGRKMLAEIFQPFMLDDPLVILLVLTVMQFLLRRHWAAVAGTMVLLVMTDGHWFLQEAFGVAFWAALVEVVIVCAICLFALLRFGLLAMVTMFFFFNLLQKWPLTLDTSAWFGGTSLTAMLVLAAIATAAMRTSLGRAPKAMLPSNGT